MTNGEVIESLFPNVGTNFSNIIDLNLWWKAEYKEPKTGHWIEDDITERSKSAYKHKCDRCGAYHRAMYDYCPSCGARMESEDEK